MKFNVASEEKKSHNNVDNREHFSSFLISLPCGNRIFLIISCSFEFSSSHRSRIFTEIFLFHLVFISTSDCSSTSSCKLKERNVEGNEDVIVGSFKNLSGNALEEAVIDEILQRSKSNAEHHRRVHMRHLEITRITRNMLRNFTDILSIDLQSNLIDDIESGSFDANTKLEKIDLMGNRLVKITKHIFSGNFRELEAINLSFNAIVGIESGAFEKVVNLKSIDLSGNCIRHLHSDLFKHCMQLREVNLHNNDIIKVAFNLFSVKAHLKVLDLSLNHLHFIPEFEARSIEHFDVSFNNITHFDLNYESEGRRRKLARIETLTVAFNRISLCLELREVRDDIVHLDVSNNEIFELSHFPQLPNLEVLNLAQNNISKLTPYADDFSYKFPSLRVLNITLNDCADYRFMRSNFPHISLSVDANFTHHCSNILHDDSFDDEMQQHSIDLKIANEIFRQLKLNHLLLIILLSAIIIIAVIHTTFVLCKHFRSIHVAMIKRGKSLIENIEL